MNLESVLGPQEMEDLDVVARQAFECLAGLSPAAVIPEAVSPLLGLHASVEYSGPALGRLLINCNPEFAYAFTTQFMQVAPPVSFDADVADALGELANTVGGNYKGLLPPDTALSIPVVSNRQSSREALPKEQELGRLLYAFEGGQCEVVVLGRLAAE